MQYNLIKLDAGAGGLGGLARAIRDKKRSPVELVETKGGGEL